MSDSLPSNVPLSLDEAQKRFREFQAASAAGRRLTPAELREVIELTRMLRRTNTGPGRTKTQASARRRMSSTAISLEDI